MQKVKANPRKKAPNFAIIFAKFGASSNYFKNNSRTALFPLVGLDPFLSVCYQKSIAGYF